jgi:isopentenyl diphosphate isomerase/L-lactate dehydrogenase-like FMN-dependent dehydrogenase
LGQRCLIACGGYIVAGIADVIDRNFAASLDHRNIIVSRHSGHHRNFSDGNFSDGNFSDGNFSDGNFSDDSFSDDSF